MTITRSEVMTRATTVWEPGTVPYSQSDFHDPDGYRQDCSGFVSMCWGLPSSENTESLFTEGWMSVISPNDLKAGDAVGHCGPGTIGDAGHVQLFDCWLNDDPNDNRYYCWQQNGDGDGPRRDLVDFPLNFYAAYRYRDIVDDPAPVSEPAPGPVNDPPPILAPGEVDDRQYVDVVAFDDDPDQDNHSHSTMWGIATSHGMAVDELHALNPAVEDVAVIHPGDRIRVK